MRPSKREGLIKQATTVLCILLLGVVFKSLLWDTTTTADIVTGRKISLADRLRDSNSKKINVTQLCKLSALFEIRNFTYPFSMFQLDAEVSNQLPLDRRITDTRPTQCKSLDYHNVPEKQLVSVVIPFFDELWSMLLRTIHSVVARTPAVLLKEIILVNDCSRLPDLGAKLEKYVSYIPKVIILKNRVREGLIRARVRGAKSASGEYVVFLDAHTEVGYNWLPPLLDALITNQTTIAIPHIDSIDPQTIQYKPWVGELHGGFSWTLDYIWKFPPKETRDRIAASPVSMIATETTIGCAMAMSRDYFFHMGAFDEGMFIWGGENLEISFRTWMCGGSLHIIPCSRVGHVFRAYLPYRFPTKHGGPGVIKKNYQRLADVWMDEYKMYYYASIHKIIPYTDTDIVSLEHRKNLRRNLKCRNFKWYLENVAKDMSIPPKDAVYHGQIKNVKGWTCMSYSNTFTSNVFLLTDCTRFDKDVIFTLNNASRLTTYSQHTCFGVSDTGVLINVSCDEPQNSPTKSFNLQWHFSPGSSSDLVQQYIPAGVARERTGQLKITTPKSHQELCMSQVSFHGSTVAWLEKCNVDNAFQFWSFTYKFKAIKNVENK